MKKVFMIIALVCLAVSSAFAATVTDWQTWDADDVLTDYISDLETSTGFVLNVPEEMEGATDAFDFISRSVDGWLFDPNKPVSVNVTGLDSLQLASYLPTDTVSMLCIQLYDSNDMDHVMLYGKDITGDGVYAFTDDDFITFDGDAEFDSDVHIGGVDVYIYDASGGSHYTLYAVPGSNASVEFLFDEEEDPIDVPEPATYAYGALGLVSLLGMKRRIRK